MGPDEAHRQPRGVTQIHAALGVIDKQGIRAQTHAPSKFVVIDAAAKRQQGMQLKLAAQIPVLKTIAQIKCQQQKVCHLIGHPRPQIHREFIRCLVGIHHRHQIKGNNPIAK